MDLTKCLNLSYLTQFSFSWSCGWNILEQGSSLKNITPEHTQHPHGHSLNKWVLHCNPVHRNLTQAADLTSPDTSFYFLPPQCGEVCEHREYIWGFLWTFSSNYIMMWSYLGTDEDKCPACRECCRTFSSYDPHMVCCDWRGLCQPARLWFQCAPFSVETFKNDLPNARNAQLINIGRFKYRDSEHGDLWSCRSTFIDRTSHGSFRQTTVTSYCHFTLSRGRCRLRFFSARLRLEMLPHFHMVTPLCTIIWPGNYLISLGLQGSIFTVFLSDYCKTKT